jgi:hypothetical protein
MNTLTATSEFKTMSHVAGTYMDQEYTGRISDETRTTPDHKNIMFHIILDKGIVVFGQERSSIYVTTNDKHATIALV